MIRAITKGTNNDDPPKPCRCDPVYVLLESHPTRIGCRLNARPTIVGNECSRNKAAGIGFDDTESGEADVLNNRVFDNAKVAIGIHSGWKVRLAGNELSRPKGLPPIVMVFKGAEADFSDNTFRGSGVAGIRAEGIIRVTNNTFDCPTLRAGGPPQFSCCDLLRFWPLESEMGKETEANGGRADQGHECSRHKVDKPAEIHEQEIANIRQATDECSEEDRCG